MTAAEQPVLDVEADDAEVVDEQHTPTTAALVPVANVAPGSLMRPIATRADTVQAFHDYQDLRNELLVPSDFQRLDGKDFPKKSAWRKLAVAMGTSDEIKSRDYDRDDQGRIVRAEVTVRATAPNGRYAEGLGVCDAKEKCKGNNCRMNGNDPCDGFRHFSKPQHDIPSTAHTRAKNRALSDLFGFGEVSAEEVGTTNNDDGDKNEPADGAEVDKLVAALNSIPQENGQRRGAKLSFVNKFGQPHELTKGQIEAAWRMVTASGGNKNAGAAETTHDSSQTQGEDPAAPPQGDPNQPGDDDPKTRQSQAPGPVQSSSPPSPSPDRPPSEGDGNADGRGSPAGIPRPSAPPAPPATNQQKRELGQMARELIAEGKLKNPGDKAEIVAILTDSRASSTSDMYFDEAAHFSQVLGAIRAGDLAMVDDPDTEGARCLAGITDAGKVLLKNVGLI